MVYGRYMGMAQNMSKPMNFPYDWGNYMELSMDWFSRENLNRKAPWSEWENHSGFRLRFSPTNQSIERFDPTEIWITGEITGELPNHHSPAMTYKVPTMGSGPWTPRPPCGPAAGSDWSAAREVPRGGGRRAWPWIPNSWMVYNGKLMVYNGKLMVYNGKLMVYNGKLMVFYVVKTMSCLPRIFLGMVST